MEYQFRCDLGGEPVALMSMDHEAIGRFLTEECQSSEMINQLQQIIEQLQQGELSEWRFNSAEQALKMTQEYVRVRDHVLEQDHDQADEFDPDLNFYDAESEALCGLEDFDFVLAQWRDFIRR